MQQELQDNIIHNYPAPIASTFHQMSQLENEDSESLVKHIRLRDVYEAIVKYIAVLILSYYRTLQAQDLDNPQNYDSIFEDLINALHRPSLGDWKAVLDIGLKKYKTADDNLLIAQLSDWYLKSRNDEELITAFREIKGYFNQKDSSKSIRYIDLFQMLVTYRNGNQGWEAHGTTKGEYSYYAKRVNILEPAFTRMLQDLSFITEYPPAFLIECKQQIQRNFKLRMINCSGIRAAMKFSLTSPVGFTPKHIYIINKEKEPKPILELHPLVLYVEELNEFLILNDTSHKDEKKAKLIYLSYPKGETYDPFVAGHKYKEILKKDLQDILSFDLWKKKIISENVDNFRNYIFRELEDLYKSPETSSDVVRMRLGMLRRMFRIPPESMDLLVQEFLKTYEREPVIIPPKPSTPSEPKFDMLITSLDFGEVIINQKVNKILSIRNIGNSDLIISDIESSDKTVYDISLVTFTILPGSAQDVSITFKPKACGEIRGHLGIFSNDPVNSIKKIVLSGIGKPAVPKCELPITSLNFSRVRVNTSTNLSLEIRNTGSADLKITDIVSSKPPTYTASPTSVIVTPGNSQFITVTFTPDAAISIDGRLKIETNDPSESVREIMLTGMGTPIETDEKNLKRISQFKIINLDSPVSHIAISSRRDLICICEKSGIISLLNYSGELLWQDSKKDPVRSVIFSEKDEKIYTTSWKGLLRIYGFSNPRPIKELNFDGVISQFQIQKNKDNLMLIGTWAGSLYSLKDNELNRILHLNHGISALATINQGEFTVIGDSNGVLHFYDKDFKEIWKLVLKSYIQFIYTLDSQNRFVVGTIGGYIFCFDKKQREHWRFGAESPVESFVLSPNEKKLFLSTRNLKILGLDISGSRGNHESVHKIFDMDTVTVGKQIMVDDPGQFIFLREMGGNSLLFISEETGWNYNFVCDNTKAISMTEDGIVLITYQEGGRVTVYENKEKIKRAAKAELSVELKFKGHFVRNQVNRLTLILKNVGGRKACDISCHITGSSIETITQGLGNLLPGSSIRKRFTVIPKLAGNDNYVLTINYMDVLGSKEKCIREYGIQIKNR